MTTPSTDASAEPPAAGAPVKPRPLKAVEAAPAPAHRAPRPAELRPVPGPRPARLRLRHYAWLLSFALLVLVPFGLTVAYLFGRAADQYHSEIAFSIRSEDTNIAAAGLLGALTQVGSGSATDADILFDFIRSPEIVAEIDAELDLRAIYNRAEGDPVFMLGDDPSDEALLAHWNRMVEVGYDKNTGIIRIRANAFTAEDGRAITDAILVRSSAVVNRLSEQAREDAVRFADEELAEAEAHLREVRQQLATFRRDHNIVDPQADLEGEAGVLGALQEELARALVERDVMLTYTADTDQRVAQATRRIDAITSRIESERGELVLTGVEGSLPEVVGRYEELVVDLEFANTAYVQTLAGLAAARAEARRQSRYLAPHVRPTLATSALYPRRLMLSGLAGLFLLLGWSVAMLVYYNVRDNR